ncbi:hypothetical protein LSAT2_013521, partial [Lamellibrachia satsuma]
FSFCVEASRVPLTAGPIPPVSPLEQRAVQRFYYVRTVFVNTTDRQMAALSGAH